MYSSIDPIFRPAWGRLFDARTHGRPVPAPMQPRLPGAWDHLPRLGPPFNRANFALPADTVLPAVAALPAKKPLLYPATNLPAMWQALGPLIQKSPRLCFQLDQMQKAGWRVEWSPSAGPHCDWNQRVVRLRTGDTPLVCLQNLAHEVRHALQAPCRPAQYPSELAYSHAVMDLEAEAAANHLAVRQEIRMNSGVDIGIVMRDPAYYDTLYSRYQKHGDERRLLAQIKNMYGWETSSISNTSYWQTSVNEWRKLFGVPTIQIPPPLLERGRALAWGLLHREMQSQQLRTARLATGGTRSLQPRG